MRNKIIIILLVFASLLAVIFMRDLIIKSVVGSVITGITGAPTRVGGLSLSVIKQKFRIINFRMYNPKGFPSDILVDIPNIYVAYDLGSMLKGKLYIKQIDFELKEMGIVKNKEGKLNVDSLKIVEQGKPGISGKAAIKQLKEIPMRIDLVNLDIGKIVSREYRVNGPPRIKVHEVNLKKSYRNITSVQQLTLLILSESLKSAGISGLKLYGLTVFTGVAALPIAAAFTFSARDYAQESFGVTPDKAYAAGLKALKGLGAVDNGNEPRGAINAVVDGAHISLRLKEVTKGTTQITVSARKFGLPAPEIASGVMYKITDELK